MRQGACGERKAVALGTPEVFVYTNVRPTSGLNLVSWTHDAPVAVICGATRNTRRLKRPSTGQTEDLYVRPTQRCNEVRRATT